MAQQGPVASWGWELQGLHGDGEAWPHHPELSHHPSRGAGQAEGQPGTASALGIRRFPGDGDRWHRAGVSACRLGSGSGLVGGTRVRHNPRWSGSALGTGMDHGQAGTSARGSGSAPGSWTMAGPRPGCNTRVVAPAGAKSRCLGQNQSLWAGIARLVLSFRLCCTDQLYSFLFYRQ